MKNQMSRSKAKKLKQLEKKKESGEIRSSVLEELKKYSLNKDQASLMQPTSTSNINKRKQIELANKRQAFGLDLLPNQLLIEEKLHRKKLKKDQKLKHYNSIPDELIYKTETQTEQNELFPQSKADEDADCFEVEIPTPLQLYDSIKGSIKKNKIDLDNSSSQSKKKSQHNNFKYSSINIERNKIIQQQRMKLPALMVEHEIIEAALHNNVVIISGDTGSGKSTQVPQFLYEAGFTTPDCKIAVTQPRRVAAISVSKRVGIELNNSKLVGYQVRYDRSFQANSCSIKFMTDGILMKEIQNDFLCKKYSTIVIDEAHERSVNCDILIGLLSRVVTARQEKYDSGELAIPPLKLLIMSATLRHTDFTENNNLFPDPPPIINIESKTHPITIHFERTTEENYITAAKHKIMQIHRKLPAGSILAFVSGKREVYELSNALKSINTANKFTQGETKTSEQSDSGDSEEDENYQDQLPEVLPHEITPNISSSSTEINNEETSQQSNYHEETGNNATETENPADFELNDETNDEEYPLWKEKLASTKWQGSDASGQLSVIPLHASLSAAEQMMVFREPSPLERLVVISTNVAETSITIPNIRYIVDTGKEKKRHYLESSGISYFKIQWISKASSDQRAGRCGRVGPGHCYRLYSSAIYENYFPIFPPVSILMTPLESTLLFISSLGISQIARFPFPTKPNIHSMKAAAEILYNLGAIKPFKHTQAYFSFDSLTVCTRLGKNLANIPILPRYAKILLTAAARSQGKHESLLQLTSILISYLTIGNIYNELDNNKAEQFKEKLNVDKSQFQSDLDYFLWVFRHYIQSKNKNKFCHENKLNAKSLEEVVSLSNQIYRLISHKLNYHSLKSPTTTSLPSLEEKIFLHDCLLEGLVDRIAIRAENIQKDQDTPYDAYISPELPSGKFCYIHPRSILKYKKPLPQLLVYSHIIKTNKNYIQECFAIDSFTLAKVDSPLIEKGKFLTIPIPMYLANSDSIVGFVSPLYRPLEYQLPTIETQIPKTNNFGYKIFAKALVEGSVFPILKEYSEFMISDPSTFLIKPSIQQNKLIKALQSKQSCSKIQLLKTWNNDKNFLLQEYVQLLEKASYDKLIKLQELWPPI